MRNDPVIVHACVRAGLLLSLALFFAAGASAQPAPSAPAPAAPPSPAAPAATEPVPALEPKAIDILKASSDRLAAARTVSFTAVAAYESPSRPGPPLLYTTRSTVTLQRPDKLRVITPGDGPASEFYYNGKTMMAFMPTENLVAVADAPPTIDAALETAYHTAAIYFPFTDAMVADPYADIAKAMDLAFYIGQSRVIGGTKTDMVAYSSHGVFVQIWIGAEDKLPRMARAVFRNDPQRLRHQVEFFDWQLDRAVPAGTFASPRAAAAKRIPFARPDPNPQPDSTTPVQAEPPKTK